MSITSKPKIIINSVGPKPKGIKTPKCNNKYIILNITFEIYTFLITPTTFPLINTFLGSTIIGSYLGFSECNSTLLFLK